MVLHATPIHCPHGTPLEHEAGGTRRHRVWAQYQDGCWSTNGGSEARRFWCGNGEVSKANGVSVTEGEYLRAWADALILNVGDDFYDEAENIDYFRTLEANDHAEHGYEPCGCLSNSAGAHRGSCPAYLGEVPWSDRVDD